MGIIVSVLTNFCHTYRSAVKCHGGSSQRVLIPSCPRNGYLILTYKLWLATRFPLLTVFLFPELASASAKHAANHELAESVALREMALLVGVTKVAQFGT